MGSTLNDRFVIRDKPEERLPSLLSSSGRCQSMLALGSMPLRFKRSPRRSRRRYGEESGPEVCLISACTTEVSRMVAMVEAVDETPQTPARVGEAGEHPVE